MPRTPTLVGAPLRDGGLSVERIKSSKAALSSVPFALAGHNRLYYEHTTGNAITDQQPCAPLNPRGRLGHDHSGAGFGDELRHTYFWWGLGPVDSGISDKDDNREPPTAKTDPLLGQKSGWVDELRVFVPAAFPGSNYQTARVDGVVHVVTALAGAQAKMELLNTTAIAGSATANLTWSIASTGLVGHNVTLDVVPGRVNRIKIDFYAQGTGAKEVQLVALSFTQAT